MHSLAGKEEICCCDRGVSAKDLQICAMRLQAILELNTNLDRSLSWGISKGDQKVAEEYANITSSEMRLRFAEFLARHGKREKGSCRTIHPGGLILDI